MAVKKKILVAGKSLGGGGSEIAMIELLNRLGSNREWKVTLLLLDHDDEYASHLIRNLDIRYIEFTHKWHHKLISAYSFAGKCLKKLKVNAVVPYYDFLMGKVSTELDDDYDIALDAYGYGSFLTGFVARKIKAEKKATWLHAEDQYWMGNVSRYLPEYDRVFCVSNAVRDEFCRRYPEHREKAETLYNSRDYEAIRKKADAFLPREYDGRFRILTVGRLHPEKGWDIALEAAKLLKEQIPGKFAWYWIGSGRDEKKMRKRIKKYGLENLFYLLGSRENPFPYMKHCDLYMQPSRHEGYGLALLEARCIGACVLASDIPPFREQIADAGNGYLVSLNVGKMTEKILNLYRDRSTAERISQNAKASLQDYSKEIEKIYGMLTEGDFSK